MRPRNVPRAVVTGSPPRGPACAGLRQREHAHVARRPTLGRQPVERREQLRVVGRVGGIGAGVALRADARTAVERVDLQPGVVGQRRQARQAGVEPRLERAFASNVSPVSSGSPAAPTSSSETSSARSRASSSRSSRELVRGARRDDEAASSRATPLPPPARDQRRTVAIAAAWAANSWRSPSSARSMSRSHRRAIERLALGRALELDVGLLVRADDVEVDLGAGVLGVVEVEMVDAVDDAHRHGRDLADEMALHAVRDERRRQRDVAAGDRGGPRPAVGAEDVAVDGDRALAESAPGR